MKILPRLILTGFIATCGGCNFVPPSQAPEMEIPPGFKEGGGWKVAKPAAGAPRGEWWSIFKDSELNAILRSVDVSNQSLQSAAAVAEQTAALLKSAKWSFVPTAEVDASATRSKTGSLNSSGDPNSSTGTSARTVRTVTGTSSWEVDLWGRLRHGARAAVADVQAAQANVESTRLSLQSQAAQTYFSLRAAETQKRLLEGEVANFQKSLDITRNRKEQGVASAGDVALAETQIAAARTALIELDVQRSTLEHALANLTGRAPAAFGVGRGSLAAKIPSLPPSTPSVLLERRPDIANAERRVAAANERIGAARAAFFPTLTLSADYGWRGLSNLFAGSNSLWSLGANAAAPILDRGSRIAAKAQADAVWKQTVADYRQTVLTALQEAEDALATLRILALESTAQAETVRAARENERIALNQYVDGTLSYLNVATAQAASLQAESNAISLQARRLNATVALIKALGGNW
jgi:NodT family efflux transporter outer membrane factor (OMF) lipoprotein